MAKWLRTGLYRIGAGFHDFGVTTSGVDRATTRMVGSRPSHVPLSQVRRYPRAGAALSGTSGPPALAQARVSPPKNPPKSWPPTPWLRPRRSPGGHRRHLGHAFGSHERARHDRHNLPDRGDARGNDHLPSRPRSRSGRCGGLRGTVSPDAGPFESVTRWRHGLDAFRVQARRGPPRR